MDFNDVVVDDDAAVVDEDVVDDDGAVVDDDGGDIVEDDVDNDDKSNVVNKLCRILWFGKRTTVISQPYCTV